MTPLASAGVKFTSPAAGATLTAGTAIDVKWEDDGKDPKLSDMLTYELFVFAGGNEDGTNVSLRPLRQLTRATCGSRD